LLGTGLCHGAVDQPITGAAPGAVYLATDPGLAATFLKELSGTAKGAELVGFVVEGSQISQIRFEVSKEAALEESMIVFANINGKQIFYQILDALTAEESFQQNPRGTHIVEAAQLGTLNVESGFLKYAWVPPMNQPIFKLSGADLPPSSEVKKDEFVVGQVPHTAIGVRVRISELIQYHSAILGVTGTGKTELALDIITQAVENGAKVFCVDFTGEYRRRLSALKPELMGLSVEHGAKLSELFFDVETGRFGAKEEKKKLQGFIDKLQPKITERTSKFLNEGHGSVAIFELNEVTNSRATLRTTELFLSAIMSWAKQNRQARRILIVLEEAHTIIPETAFAGFDDATQWVVNRIGQIALQGRKYGVGLLVITQRTALVSKTILSQCNTYFTFSLVDQTSLNYLTSIYSQQHVKGIPNLRFCQFLAFGKAVCSERPVVVARPYDEKKLEASRALNATTEVAERTTELAGSEPSLEQILHELNGSANESPIADNRSEAD